jgi:carotenoid 1,2-hydratase
MPEPAATTRPGPPRFDRPVAPGGYQWWYLDALDPAGERGIVVIAFVGSVFSPYYFRARRRGCADPQDHCAINVGLYRRRGKIWCMTERRAGSVRRSASRFRIGPSTLHWNGSELVIDLRERCMPFGQRLRGQVRARPGVISDAEFALDTAGRHHWMPWAPLAEVQVDFDRPGESWQGHGYLDGNRGDEPLEQAFVGWNWSRLGDSGAVDVRYELSARDGSRRALALRFDEAGHAELPAGLRFQLPSTAWRVPRTGLADARVELLRTLEDTPFYARSLLCREGASGATARGVHEALSLQRFRRDWVRTLLPFRMPRERRASAI